MKRSISIWSILLIATMLATGTVAQEDDYFPLKVGNQWRFVLQNATSTVFNDLTISGVIQINVESITKDTVLAEGLPELPQKLSGISYFLLEGTLVKYLIINQERSIDALLIRKTNKDQYTYLEGIPDEILETDLSGMIWLRGILKGGQWIIFSQDRPLWNPAPSLGIHFHTLSIEKDQPDHWSYEFRSDSFNNSDVLTGSISTPAGKFLNPRSIRIQANTESILHFAPKVGIVALNILNGRAYQLNSATVNGVVYNGISTIFNTVSWGLIKGEIIHDQ